MKKYEIQHMKQKQGKKYIQLILFFPVVLSLIIANSEAVAANYLGEFCWKINDPETANTYVLGKFAVTDVGDGHFSLNGSFANFENNVLTQTDVAHGNAEIANAKVVVTLANTFYVAAEEYGFSMINFQLDASTLSGTARTIDTAQQFSSDTITKEYAESPVTFAPNCQ